MPMSTFWIIFTSEATSSASGPSMAAAATTGPVLSTVPPINAPPMAGLSPAARMAAGIPSIISTVRTSVSDTVKETSSWQPATVTLSGAPGCRTGT